MSLQTLIRHMGIPNGENAEYEEEGWNPNWNAIHNIILSRKNAEALFDMTLIQMALQIKGNTIPPHVLCAILEKNDYVTRKVLLPEPTFRFVCENSETSPDVMRSLLDAQKYILTLEHVIAWDLMNISARCGNVDATKVLIDRFPDALSASNERREIPLHEACALAKPEMVRLLLREGLNHEVGGESCVGGLYAPNVDFITPLDKALDTLHLHYHDTESWTTVEICLQFSYMAKVDTSIHKYGDVPILHAAIALIPVSFLPMFIERYNVSPSIVDCFGRDPLMAVIHYSMRSNKTCYWKNVYQMILDDRYGGRSCALVNHGENNRLPLHVAIDSGLAWENGLEEIVKANFDALGQKDNHTGLFPFMQAAFNGDLTSAYLMLQNNPTIIMFNPSPNRKRKTMNM